MIKTILVIANPFRIYTYKNNEGINQINRWHNHVQFLVIFFTEIAITLDWES